MLWACLRASLSDHRTMKCRARCSTSLGGNIEVGFFSQVGEAGDEEELAEQEAQGAAARRRGTRSGGQEAVACSGFIL